MQTAGAIPQPDLVERFLRADGPGGQHVSRTESAVELGFAWSIAQQSQPLVLDLNKEIRSF